VVVKLPLHPGHPERICWGCAKYCPADDMACGNGTDRGQHPIEIFGKDWLETGLDGTVPEVADHPRSKPDAALVHAPGPGDHARMCREEANG
jgi:Protein of unknown function (DUF3079)